MDIDLLWSLGGWFLDPYCMATITATPPTKTKAPIHNFNPSSTTPPLLALLGLIFIVLLFIPTTNQFKQSMTPTFPYPSRRSLILSTSSVTVAPSRAKFHRRKETNRNKTPITASAKQFNVSAHEVPSGENPASNR